MNIGDLFVALRGDVTTLRGQIQKDLGAVAGEQGQKQGQAFADKYAQQIRTGTRLAGAAMGTFVAGATQEFGKFDDGMRRIFSILPGITQETMDSMEGEVKSLAKEMGRLPEDIIPGVYDALSSGIPQENVFAFMEAAAKG